jgi:predicted permease
MILQIFTTIILPIFALIGAGILLDRAVKPDLPTLSKLNFYVFVPAVVFVKLVDSELNSALVGMVTGFNILHLLILLGVSWALFGLAPFRRNRPMLTSAALFNNCGNYGLPFAQLAFGDFGVQVMVLILVFQNVASFTLGLWLMGDAHLHWKDRTIEVLKTPALIAVAAAMIVKGLHIPLPEAIHFPMVQISNGLVPIALLTLGVQISRTRWWGEMLPLSAASGVRLIVSPLIAIGLGWTWMHITPLPNPQVVPVLICGSALPVAVNVYIVAMQYNRQPELASRIIFWSTLASSVTLTAWLAIFG